jgi:ABC-type transport system involved in multi-copper enzyme maturation permease subunit
MVCLISPALTAGAISAEHEHQTYDLLRTTLLSARDLVLGKLASSLSFMLILVLAALPLQMLGFFFGGVSMEEIIVAFLILVFSALAFNALGIFFSSFIHRTLPSTVLSYVTSILLIFGVPVILWFLLLFGSLFAFGGSSSLSEAVENILLVLIYVVGYTVIAINPLSTVVASEIMLIERQSIFYTTLSMGNNWNFPVVAPWITYLVFYTLLSILLISVSILFVKRTEK